MPKKHIEEHHRRALEREEDQQRSVDPRRFNKTQGLSVIPSDRNSLRFLVIKLGRPGRTKGQGDRYGRIK